jgi:hypothetical protein
MGFENRPPEVRRAIEEGNLTRLSAAGKKGAKAAQYSRDKKAVEHDVLAAAAEIKLLEEELERMESTNEHILPID